MGIQLAHDVRSKAQYNPKITVALYFPSDIGESILCAPASILKTWVVDPSNCRTPTRPQSLIARSLFSSTACLSLFPFCYSSSFMTGYQSLYTTFSLFLGSWPVEADTAIRSTRLFRIIQKWKEHQQNCTVLCSRCKRTSHLTILAMRGWIDSWWSTAWKALWESQKTT